MLALYDAYSGAYEHKTMTKSDDRLRVNNFNTADSDCGTLGVIPKSLPPQVARLRARELVLRWGKLS